MKQVSLEVGRDANVHRGGNSRSHGMLAVIAALFVVISKKETKVGIEKKSESELEKHTQEQW